MSSASPFRTLGLRYSHAVIGIAAIHQLIGSEFMEPPWEFDEASALQQLLFEFHEWMGLTAAAALAVLAFGLWRRYGAGLRAQFLPWLDPQGRREMLSQAREAISGFRRMAPPIASRVSRLAAAWEGLGLLTMLFMATSGIAMVLAEDAPRLMHDIGEIHELGALPLKLYLAGHVGMALVHELRGEGLIRRMWLGHKN